MQVYRPVTKHPEVQIGDGIHGAAEDEHHPHFGGRWRHLFVRRTICRPGGLFLAFTGTTPFSLWWRHYHRTPTHLHGNFSVSTFDLHGVQRARIFGAGLGWLIAVALKLIPILQVARRCFPELESEGMPWTIRDLPEALTVTTGKGAWTQRLGVVAKRGTIATMTRSTVMEWVWFNLKQFLALFKRAISNFLLWLIERSRANIRANRR